MLNNKNLQLHYTMEQDGLENTGIWAAKEPDMVVTMSQEKHQAISIPHQLLTSEMIVFSKQLHQASQAIDSKLSGLECYRLIILEIISSKLDQMMDQE